MPEEKLIIDFIASQLRMGIRNEKIRSDLLSNGWNDVDIDKAFGIVKLRAERRFKINPIAIIIVIIILMISAGVGVYFYTKEDTKQKITNENKVVFPDLDPVVVDNTENSTTTATTTIKKDIEQVSYKDIFEKQVTDFKYVRFKKEGEKTIITGIPKDENSTTTTKDFVFIKENNAWTLSLIETKQREDYLLDIASSTKVSLAILEVSNIKAWPSPPLASSPKTYIEISVKNTGNITAPNGLKMKVAFSDRKEAELSYTKPISPLETVSLKYYPYPDKNKKYTDKSGKYDISIYIEGSDPYSKTIDLY